MEIHQECLTEYEAESLESNLIDQHGEHLVNWVNSGRQMDYVNIDEYHRQRNANLSYVAETKALEKTHPEEAIKRYRNALETNHSVTHRE